MTDLPPPPGLPRGLAQSLGASRPGAGGLGCYRVQGRPPAAGARGQQGSLQPPAVGGDSDARSLLTLGASPGIRSHASRPPPSTGLRALLPGSPAWNRSRRADGLSWSSWRNHGASARWAPARRRGAGKVDVRPERGPRPRGGGSGRGRMRGVALQAGPLRTQERCLQETKGALCQRSGLGGRS